MVAGIGGNYTSAISWLKWTNESMLTSGYALSLLYEFIILSKIMNFSILLFKFI